MFAELDPKWKELQHAHYPEVLRGEVTRKLKRELKFACKNGDRELINQLQTGIAAAYEMAIVMTAAYSTRVVADYQPETQVSFNGTERFSLNKIDITAAHEWMTKVQHWTTAIREAWIQVRD